MTDIDLNTTPYFDDYDESKNFHHILFKPGVSVQARELTQLQTILQTQIERHATHIFKEGARVLGGELTFTGELRAIKIEDTNSVINVADYVDQLVGTTVRGETSGVKGVVVATTAATATDALTLYINYTANGIDKTSVTFADAENLLTESGVATYAAGERVAATIAAGAAQTGVGCSVAVGVYYIKGAFVQVEPQTIVLSKYTTDINARIGLTATETIVSSETDASLLDNATGSPNFAAPGADRLAVDLVLTSLDVGTVSDANFIEIERITDGKLTGKVRSSEYSKLEENLAQRTFDLNGNVEVIPFNLKMKESINDYQNLGVYTAGVTTSDGNTAAEPLMALHVSEGKAYIEGYELETIGSVFVDVEKSRETNTIAGGAVALEVGNYVKLENLHGMPDIVDYSGSINNYPILELRDTFTVTSGAASGSLIGHARPRSIEFDGSTLGASDDVFDSATTYKMFMFDVNMLTELALDSAAQSSNILAGTRVKGATSYASGFVDSSSTSSILKLSGVSGSFNASEVLLTNNYDSAASGFNVRNAANTRDVTITTITENAFDAVKQMYYDDATIDFTADVDLEVVNQISGSVSVTTTTVSGFNTAFVTELRVGDAIDLPSGTAGVTERRIVNSITDNTNMTLTVAVTVNVTSVAASVARGTFNDQDKLLSLRKLSKEYVKVVSSRALEFRRQYLVTTNGSSEATLTSEAGATFNARSNTDYQITVLTAGTGSAVAGDMINMNATNLTFNAVSNALTLTSVSIFGVGAVLKITATIRAADTVSGQGGGAAKTKANNVAELVKVENKLNDDGVARPWGTSAVHEEISLGVGDAYELLAVYDSLDTATDAVTPTLTYSGLISGPFTAKEIVNGSSSGASAIIINATTPLLYIPLSSIGFTVGETITGVSSGASATVATLVNGSTNITSRFTLDTGQRDNYYDTAKIVRKAKAAKPVGELLVVFSHFSHGQGEYCDVTSYSGIDYKIIPFYSSTRIDPEIRSPNGTYDLRSAIDYRPIVATATRTGPDGDGAYKITSKSLEFQSRSYGASVSSTPKDNSNFSNNIEYYLPRTDSIFLTTAGRFVVVKGVADDEPHIPSEINSAIKICDVYLNPYVITIDGDVLVVQKSHKNFRKEDIARLEDRINNIEYYTSLSLLESSASRLQIKDENGLDRFKSGFLVDNFGGHKTGQVTNPDYRSAIDFNHRTLRPKQSTKNIALKEINTTDTARTISNYQRTGSLVTLPYTDVVIVDQPYATRVENLNPVLSFSWTGTLTLSPTSDEWFDENYLPDIRTNREGNFNAVLTANVNRLGTVWGATELTWTGRTVDVSPVRFSVSRQVADPGGVWGTLRHWRVERWRNNEDTTRTITDTFTGTRWGLQTSIAEVINTRQVGDRQISNELIPFMRSTVIEFSADGLKPLTRVYPFFDNVDVTPYVTPTGGSIVGTSTTRAVTTTGNWTTLYGLRLKNFWLHNHMERSKTIRAYYSQTGPSGWTQLGTDILYTSKTSGDLDLPTVPVAISPNSSGDLWIKVEIDPMEHYGWSDLEFLDQSVSTISRDLVELESFRFTNFGGGTDNTWAFNNNSAGQVFANRGSIPDWDNLTNTQFGALARRRSEAIFRVRDGVKSVVPESGSILITDNNTINQTALVTDATGSVYGKFQIPNPNITGNPKFRTGSRTLRLTSNSNNADTSLETFADAAFSSTGILQNRQRSFISTRNAQLVTNRVGGRVDTSQTSSVTTRVSSDWSAWRWMQREFFDPLAQSVQVSTEGGQFLTKVDIFFAAKDTTIPVRLQLREMESGAITNSIIPMSHVVVFPEDITTSADGSVATTFTFESPVYVTEGVEFAIVLLTDSEEYTVFISKLGETDLSGGRTVSKQPSLGVLFKSQNNSTWTAYDYEDLKFTLYRAQFDTSVNGVLNLENRPIAEKNLVTDPIECFAGGTSIKVSHYDHHMYATNNDVKISGVTSNIYGVLNGSMSIGDSDLSLTGALAFPTSGTVSLRIVNDNADYIAENDDVAVNGIVYEVVTGTISGAGSTRSVTGLTRGISPGVTARAHATALAVELYEYNGIQLQNVNKTHNITDWGLDYYVVSTGDAATESLTFGGSEVYASENAMVTNYQLLIPTTIHTGTSLTPALSLASGTSASGSETTSFTTGPEITTTLIDDVSLSTTNLVASPINEGISRSCNVKLTLSSSQENLSPVVDLERNSIVAKTNRLNEILTSADHYPVAEYIAPTASEGDLGEGIYMTKRVQLANGATALKVYLDANIFSSSSVQVMYKILRADASSSFEELGWSYFNIAGESDTIVSPATADQQFQEYSYSVDGLPEFISFAIKIKMDGTNCAVPPVLKDLRAIALAI
jgi:hypothetical protein